MDLSVENISDANWDKTLRFFQESFNLKGLSIESLKQGITIESADGLTVLDFSPRFCSIKVKFPLYKSFDAILQWFPVLTEYMGLIGCMSINMFGICKFNELSYNLPPDKSVADAMRQIFSTRLLNCAYGPDESFDADASKFPELARWEKKFSMSDESTDSELTCIYGFKENIDEPNKGSLTLRTFMEYNGAPVSVADIETSAKELNHIIDCAFHWCVTDSIINQMRRP